MNTLASPMLPRVSPLIEIGGKAMVCSRVYMGRNVPNAHDSRSAVVRDSGVDRFIDQVVMPLFPKGFTVMHANGGWQDEATGKTIREPSLVVEVVHDPDDSEDVDALARSWKRWFDQDAVMITASPVLVRFA